MIAGSVALCPELPGRSEPSWRRDLRGALLGWSIPTILLEVPEAEAEMDHRNRLAHWVGHCSIGLANAAPQTPVLLVLAGDSCAAATALGFSQRAARRALAGYILVDPVLPDVRPGMDWPDAPVTVVITANGSDDAAHTAKLRGWDVVHSDPVDAILEIAKH